MVGPSAESSVDLMALKKVVRRVGRKVDVRVVLLVGMKVVQLEMNLVEK